MTKLTRIITEDGSISYRNNEVDEAYHTKSGAEQEAKEKHVSIIEEKQIKNKKEVVIFDICFGLGYNTAAAIDKIRKNYKEIKIRVYCFENDEEILKEIKFVNANFESYDLIKKFVNIYLENKTMTHSENDIELIMLYGDAKKTIKKISALADYVFLDPFSPKKTPEMWEEKFFKEISQKMNCNGKLSTYSCAKSVRLNLQSGGFSVFDGPIIGRRSPSTIAIKKCRK